MKQAWNVDWQQLLKLIVVAILASVPGLAALVQDVPSRSEMRDCVKHAASVEQLEELTRRVEALESAEHP